MSQSEQRPHRAASGPVLDEDERGELERLRGEVAALRAAPAPRRARIRSASLAAAFLPVLGCVDLVTGGRREPGLRPLGMARAAFLAVALPGLVLALLALRLHDYRSIPEPSRGTGGGGHAAARAVGSRCGGRGCAPAHHADDDPHMGLQLLGLLDAVCTLLTELEVQIDRACARSVATRAAHPARVATECTDSLHFCHNFDTRSGAREGAIVSLCECRGGCRHC